jgi:hypothetical protein
MAPSPPTKRTSRLLTMAENPDYWNTIATVIPVIALTYATALKRSDWHRLKPITRRWIALYGAAVVTALVWAEWIALKHLQQKSTSALDESLTLTVVGAVAVQVVAVPIAPLIVLAIHDLHPKVIRAKRSIKSDERALAKIRKEYSSVLVWVDHVSDEYRIEGMEQVLNNPHLVYTEHGAVIPGYEDRVAAWQSRRRFIASSDQARSSVEEKLRFLEKRLRASKKRLAKILRKITKKTAELTDLHG